jgi:hypothetical protein
MQEIKQFFVDGLSDLRTIIAVVALLFGLCSLILGFIGYRRHKRKKLSYEVISNTPLLSVNSEVKDRIKIYLDEREVTDVNLVMIKLSNTGNDTIHPKDYESAIVISFGNANLLSFELFERVPRDMPIPHTILFPNGVSLSPFLMNEDDSMTIKLLISGEVNAPTITARIAGIKKIENGNLTRMREGTVAIFLKFIMSTMMTTLISVIGIWVMYSTPGRSYVNKVLPIVTLVILVAILAFTAYKSIPQRYGK